VRVSLTDEGRVIRVNAVIVWASFEIAPKTGPRYRAGLEFLNVDPATVEALIALCHKRRE
jgi:c-di-GMP-binding flagellar brake protein YcgR